MSKKTTGLKTDDGRKDVNGTRKEQIRAIQKVLALYSYTDRVIEPISAKYFKISGYKDNMIGSFELDIIKDMGFSLTVISTDINGKIWTGFKFNKRVK